MTHLPLSLPALLLGWYDQNHRALPWRDHPTPYRVLVSEMMLQQTRVETVIPYFTRFVAELPGFAALAEVPDDRLAKLWEGLGYYARARNLKQTAVLVMERHGGDLPGDYGELRALPGLGDYAAGAVGSIAFGLRVPAVDGNVLRVVARLISSADDIMKPPVRRRFTELIRGVLPDRRCGDFNQALMELGATVCLPNGAPKCLLCPLHPCCKGFEAGTAPALPVRSPKPPRRVEERTVLLVRKSDRVFLCKRPPKGLLAGLWEFPSLTGHVGPTEISDLFPDANITPLPDAKHTFTHIEWRMQAFLVETATAPPWDGEWACLTDIGERYAIPSAYAAWSKTLPGLLS